MTTKKKLLGKPFQKGQSGNPNGRPKLPKDVVEAKQLNRVELERVLNRLIHKTEPELNEVINSNDSTSFEKLIANIIVKGIRQGDQMRANFLLDRLVGKVKEHVEHTVRKAVVITRKDGSEVVFTDKESDETDQST